jgi:hypothetical protein
VTLEVLQFIEDLITKGFAYQTDDGNVFFDVEKYIFDSHFTCDELDPGCYTLAKPCEISQRKNYKHLKDHIMILCCGKRQSLINLSETLSFIQVDLVDTLNVSQCQTFSMVKTLI